MEKSLGLTPRAGAAKDYTMTILLGFHAKDTSLALSQIGGRAAIINDFFGFTDAFPTSVVEADDAVRAIPLLTWQPNMAKLTDITAGVHDSTIRAWAAAAKAFGKPIYLRFAHEMNGAWYSWGYPANAPADYVAAWRHVVNVFRSEGATNVQFVWCVAAGGDFASSLIESLFPGDEYVDWVSMDGYNRDSGGVWQSFASIFDNGYHLLTSMSARPVLIAETASVEDPAKPTHKAGWITQTFTHTIPNSYPAIKAACYFDAPGAGYTYPWDSSAQALVATQKVFAGMPASEPKDL